MQQQYWAMAGPEEIAKEMMRRIEAYPRYLELSGKIKLLRKSHKEYYGNQYIETIDQSLQAININHYANLIRHVLVDVTGQRPAWEPKALNTDLESTTDTQLAAGLLDYYMKEMKIEPVLNEAIEKCLFLDEGWTCVGWDVNGGEPYTQDPETGQIIYTGEIKITSHTMRDVIRDVRRKDMDQEWYIVRTFENKWNLAARYPEHAEKIAALVLDPQNELKYEINPDQAALSDEFPTDMIPVYTLYHKRTDALKDGRMTQIVCGEFTLFDGPLPYKRPYVFSAASSHMLESAFGHSYLKDLLPVQDAFNATVSAILSNQSANAVQNFQCPKGAAPRVVAVKDGLNIWEYDAKAGKLETMDLLKTAPEVFNFAHFLKEQAELLAAVSQISRGTAPATMSGTAMALLAQQAMQFSSGVQLSRTCLQENVGTAIIELLQTFAVVPRIAEIAGKSKRSMVKEFVGSDLRGISRVACDDANPLTKTSAGRVEIANNLLNTPGMIKTPEQYIGVLTTGNLEPLYEHDRSQINLIRSENEKLMEGHGVIAVFTDDHAVHVLEHSCVMNSPEARENPMVVNAVLAHIQEHLQLAQSMSPQMAAMLKQQSYAPAPIISESKGGGGAGQVMNPQSAVEQQAQQAKLPEPAEPPEINEGVPA